MTLVKHDFQNVSCRGEREVCMLQFLQPLRGHGLRSRRNASRKGKARLHTQCHSRVLVVKSSHRF